MVVHSITIINQQYTKTYTVGDTIKTKDGNKKIGSIADISKEYEDCYVGIFLIKDENKKILKSIENCPVEVSYVE